MLTWSYSSIKTFDQCPKKYFHLRVAKDVKDSGSEATVYGQAVHTAAEEYIRDGVAVPAKFKFIEPTLEALNAIEGEKHCEVKLGLKVAFAEEEYEPCGFYDKDVWWRGIADLVIINGDTAYSVDYKTSKNAKYADTKQLDIVATALFYHYPQLDKVKSALAFVVSNEFIRKTHYRENIGNYVQGFMPMLERLIAAQETDVWNPVSGPLCRFCPVVHCEHNRKN